MKTERLKIPTSDVRNIAAVVDYPATKTKKLAILCSGYLDTKDYTHLVKLAEALSEQGYTVARFDPMGTWESGGDISDYLTSQYLDDVKSILDYMLQHGNYDHVLVGGHSRGGMISMLYAARDSRISIVFAIMSSAQKMLEGRKYEDWKAKGFSVSSRDIPGSLERMEFKVPYSHVTDYMKYDLFESVKKIHAPIILVAGEKDKLVSPEDVKEIFDLANEPKKFVVIKGIGHDYRKYPEQIKVVNEKILENL